MQNDLTQGNLLTNIFRFSTVMIGHFVGAKEEAKKTKTIGNSFTLFIGLSLILTGLCLIGMKAILQLLATPAPSYQEAQAYLKVCFLGIPFIVLYFLYF